MANRYESYEKKKIKHLTTKYAEAKTVIKKLLGMLDETGNGMDSWPKDTSHNIIRLIVSDMNILESPTQPDSTARCVDCAIEVSRSVAAKGGTTRCNKCYAKRKRENRKRK